LGKLKWPKRRVILAARYILLVLSVRRGLILQPKTSGTILVGWSLTNIVPDVVPIPNTARVNKGSY
jgi:hypothetical protein